MSQCVAGPSRLEFKRLFYAGRAPQPVKSPVVNPPNPTNLPPSWNEIDLQEGRKVPRNLKHPLTSETYSPDRTFEPELGNRAAVPSKKSVHDWLQNGEGHAFKEFDGRGPKWLATTPFPLNPTFKPPPPHSDSLRTAIFKRYKELLAEGVPRPSAEPVADEGALSLETKPPSSSTSYGLRKDVSRPRIEQPRLTFEDEVHLRTLSDEYRLPKDRIRAIIRLKAFEQRRSDMGYAPQAHMQSEMERMMGANEASEEPSTTVDQDTQSSDQRVSQAVQPIIEMLEKERGEKSVVELLSPAPSQARQLFRPPVETVIPLRREGVTLSYCDTSDTRQGRAWERTNENRKSRSEHARKAAELARLANLGRLPRELYRSRHAEHMRPPPEAPAQWFT